MKTIRTYFLIAACLAGSILSAQFELEITNADAQVAQYTSTVVEYQLRNVGPSRQINIGIDLIDWYIFVKFKNAEGDEFGWKDFSLPDAGRAKQPGELFGSNETRSSSVEVFWQPQAPVFGEPGTYELTISWRGPDETIKSAPVVVNVAAPAGNDANALQILTNADALETLNSRFWEKIRSVILSEPGDVDKEAAADLVVSTYPASVYALHIQKMQQVVADRYGE